ncbi:52 kDa repressor of the inhibitor of the protein kinase-like [Diadema antillarum]|uniref:52 kDa repressor of the inhibitor of the protein kinase-like n=1 Tax=Diadema antillarum TaxID=105358 RepID=UPI003A86F948
MTEVIFSLIKCAPTVTEHNLHSDIPGDGTTPTVTDHSNTLQDSGSVPPSDPTQASSTTRTEVPYHWDIGLLVSGQSSDSDRYHYLTHSYQGREFATYEVTKKGKRVPLTFQESWLKDYEWLSYSHSQGGGYCKYCVLFQAKLAKGVLGTLVKTPFKNFSKAKGKDGILTLHDAYKYHHEAMVIGKAFLATYNNPEARIDTILDKKGQALSSKNMHILSVIVNTVKLCGMEALPLRGHRDDRTADPLTNRGVFTAILEHAAKCDPILREHLKEGKKNQQYTSKTIQNEIITVIADCLRDNILAPLKHVKYFSVIADEVTDPHGNQEVLSLCLRFVDVTDTKPHVREVFLDFLHLQRATGKRIAESILSLLDKHGLDVQDMRGQSYDGASAMASDKRGAQAVIKEKNPLALYTHCRSHVLSLAIGKACKVEVLRNMIDVINEIHLFFHLSPKRQRFLETILGTYAPESRVQKLKGLCKTRWTERHDCLEIFRSLYEYVFTCVHAMVQPGEYAEIESSWDWDAETRTRAQGFMASLRNGRNIIALVILVNGLDTVKGLSTKLQKRDADVVAAYNLIDTAIDEVRRMRADFDSVWRNWCTEAERIAADVGGEIAVPRRAKHQTHRANTPADTASEYYKRTVGIPFMDSFLQELGDRFSADNRALKSIMSLVPLVMVGLADAESLAEDLLFWEKDLYFPLALKRELVRWKSFCTALCQKGDVPDNLVDTLPLADGDVFPNIRELILVGCTSPIGSCEAERSFSALRRVKTYLRSTMTEERLAGLTLMAVHFRHAAQLDTAEVIKQFVRVNPRRLLCNSILFD